MENYNFLVKQFLSDQISDTSFIQIYHEFKTNNSVNNENENPYQKAMRRVLDDSFKNRKGLYIGENERSTELTFNFSTIFNFNNSITKIENLIGALDLYKNWLLENKESLIS